MRRANAQNREESLSKMLSRLAIYAALFFTGAWLLFYAERLQKHLTIFHERRKRTHLASNFFLKATALDYELFLRLFGGLMVVLALVLVTRTVLDPHLWN